MKTWTTIRTLDCHTAGEPLRVIVDGFPELPGETILEKRRYAREHLDHLRRALMWEPRGHADMYGCILTQPVTEDGDVGVLFLHNEGYSTMCGHGIIGLTKVGIENGLLKVEGSSPTVRIDTPAGRVTATAHIESGCVTRVSFLNVPSFVIERDLQLRVDGLGEMICDIAFGGAFYAYVDAVQVGIELIPENYSKIIEVAMRIKRCVQSSFPIVHPDGDPDLNFLYGTILVGPGSKPGIHSRNVCVFADGEVDRSPTGTGVSGRAAIHHARGELNPGGALEIESLLGTTFEVRIVEEIDVKGITAIVPEVSGGAYITGRHEFLIDPGDPLGGGFFLR